MVTRTQRGERSDAGNASGPDLAATVKESAQQIWLAGLGAFSKAQESHGKVFDALVQEGKALQRKTQATAEARFSDTATRMASMASELSAKASGQWDKLETIFEDRVAKALRKLDIPSASDIAALSERVDALARQLEGRAPARSAARAAGTGAGRTGAKAGAKAPAKAARRAAPRKPS